MLQSITGVTQNSDKNFIELYLWALINLKIVESVEILTKTVPGYSVRKPKQWHHH